MAFESLQDRLNGVFDKFKGQARLTEDNINEMMREIRLALLEADVNYNVVKDFIAAVKEKAVGEEVLKTLTKSQMIVKIVNEELVTLLGTDKVDLKVDGDPTVAMFVGLQGAGKTTHVGKIGKFLKEKHAKNPLFVACDIYRPAAIEQLQTLGAQLDIPVYQEGTEKPVSEIAKNALEFAKFNNYDYIIFDTAGRLHIDSALMDELKELKTIINPDEIMLVVDSMTGQDAVNVVESFNNELTLTGAILTKLDGDTRGGAALSIRHITKVPIKFSGVGEKLEDLEEFYPDRMASRILGMGDVLTLIEKAEAAIDEEEAKSLEKRMRTGQFDLEDFLKSMKQMRKLGPLNSIMKMMPGMNQMGMNNVDIDQKQVNRLEAVVLSMTKEERQNPGVLNHSRKQRIAAGCGQQVQDVNRLVKQFDQMKMLMKAMNGRGGNMDMNALRNMAMQKPKKQKNKKKRYF